LAPKKSNHDSAFAASPTVTHQTQLRWD
jgi:hypothetical protein